MSLAEALKDGLADMAARPGRAALQAIGVVLGVGSVVACLTLVDAMRRQTLDFFDKIGGLRKVLVRNQLPDTVKPTARERAAKGLVLSDVVALREQGTTFDLVDPVAGEDLLVRHGTYSRTRWIQGVLPGYATVYELQAARGRFLTERDADLAERVVVLGDTIARRIFGSDDPLGQPLQLGGQGFTVVGVLARKHYRFGTGGGGNALEWMNGQVLVPLPTLTLRLRGDTLGKVDYMNVMALTPELSSEAAEEVERILLRTHGVRDFQVFDRRQRLQERGQQFMAFNVTFIVSAVVSLLVGGIVITNILLASFKARVREIGIRKALGAAPLQVFVQFLVESVAVTTLAGVVGLALGKLLTIGIAAVTEVRAPISAQTVVIALGVAIGTGAVFGFYPALRAARLPPIEALRYE